MPECCFSIVTGTAADPSPRAPPYPIAPGPPMSDWRLTPENAALVVIDVQEKLMNVMPRRAETLASIQKLIGAARVLKQPTLVTAQYIKGLGPVCPEIVEATPGINPLEKMTFSCCGSEEFLRAVKD